MWPNLGLHVGKLLEHETRLLLLLGQRWVALFHLRREKARGKKENQQ